MEAMIYGRVHIIIGSYAGVGKELAGILYSKRATIFIAGRSEHKAQAAIDEIRRKHPSSAGALRFQLHDLASIRRAVEEFASLQSRLNVLVNNAGVMFPPKGTETKQAHDMILAPDGGVILGKEDCPEILESHEANYGQAKVANVLLAIKTHQLLRPQGVISVSFTPGNLRTELQRHSAGIMMRLGDYMLHPPVYGAYTELYSGWSDDVSLDKGVAYVMRWGRDDTKLLRSDIQRGIQDGLADRFWD